MKRVTGKVQLSEWSLDTIEDMQEVLGKLVLKAAGEALALAIEHEDTHMYMPWEWAPDSDGQHAKKPPDDPLTVYLCLALGSGDEADPVYSFSLRDMMKDTLETCAEDGSYADGLEVIARSMREFADEIAAAAETGKNREYDAEAGKWVTKSRPSQREGGSA